MKDKVFSFLWVAVVPRTTSHPLGKTWWVLHRDVFSSYTVQNLNILKPLWSWNTALGIISSLIHFGPQPVPYGDLVQYRKLLFNKANRANVIGEGHSLSFSTHWKGLIMFFYIALVRATEFWWTDPITNSIDVFHLDHNC